MKLLGRLQAGAQSLKDRNRRNRDRGQLRGDVLVRVSIAAMRHHDQNSKLWRKGFVWFILHIAVHH